MWLVNNRFDAMSFSAFKGNNNLTRARSKENYQKNYE